MSALASIKTSGWRASPLSSQWKPAGLLGQANDASIEAGNVVSGKTDPAPSSGVAQAADGQTSPLTTKPAQAPAASGVGPLLDSKQRALMGNSAIVSEYDSPIGKIIRSTHWDGGQYIDQTADGRVLSEKKVDVGHWDSGAQQTVGYELEEPVAKPGKEYGLNTDKKVHRIEVFDVNGKSKGYTYRLAEDRGLLKSFVQDLGPVLMGPLVGAAAPALAGGVQSLTGLSAGASQIVAGGLIGGATSAAGGGNPIKGALLGAAGGAINQFNPAGQMGVSSGWQTPVNNVIKAGASAAIKGDSIEDAVKGAVLNPVNLLKLPGWRSGKE